jgi:hypothetical protein
MPSRPGWPQLGGNIPQFVQDQFDELRDVYGEAHGVSPPPTLAIAALMQAADLESLERALKLYRKECKDRDVKHGA